MQGRKVLATGAAAWGAGAKLTKRRSVDSYLHACEGPREALLGPPLRSPLQRGKSATREGHDGEELGAAALPLELPSLFSGPSVLAGSAFTICSANATCSGVIG